MKETKQTRRKITKHIVKISGARKERIKKALNTDIFDWEFEHKGLTWLDKLFIAFMVFSAIYLVLNNYLENKKYAEEYDNIKIDYTEPAKNYETITAQVTGYNTIPEQTDNNPCIAANGQNICGRNDVVACPRKYELGTKVEIDGKIYECLDRTAKKHDGRFDINCDKDFKCPYQVTGIKKIKIYK